MTVICLKKRTSKHRNDWGAIVYSAIIVKEEEKEELYDSPIKKQLISFLA